MTRGSRNTLHFGFSTPWSLLAFAPVLTWTAFVGCGGGAGDDDDATVQDAATEAPGDDDTGDDDSSPGGDDDSSPTGDDDSSSGGDDDSSPTGDDDTTLPGDDDDSSPADPNGTFHVFRTNPVNGAWAVYEGTTLSIQFSEPFGGDLDEITVTLDGGSGPAALEKSLSGTGETLTLQGYTLAADTAYTLKIDVAQGWAKAQSTQVSFTTELPCGVNFNLGNLFTVVTWGEDPKAVGTLNNTVFKAQPQYIAALFDDVYQTSTFSIDAVVMPIGAYDSASKTLYPDQGFVSSMNCSVDDVGFVYCGIGQLVLPLDVSASPTAGNGDLFVQDAVITGNLVESGDITELKYVTMTGLVLQQDLELFITETGSEQTIGTISKYDLDLNSDGTNDGLSVYFTAEPLPLGLQGCDSSGQTDGERGIGASR